MRHSLFWRFAVWAGIVVFFAWTLYLWLEARSFEPASPVPLAALQYDYDVDEPVYPGQRYARLARGGMFFEEETASTKSFHTKLVLWGVISGVTAVVGKNPNSNTDTILVKVGDEIGDERIMAIGKGYIIVKNPSGEGVIALE